MSSYKKPVEKKKKNSALPWIVIGAAVLIGMVLLILIGPSRGEKKNNESSGESSQSQTDFTYDPSAHYFADIVMRDYGTITVELDSTYAPITVKNFVTLAASGFYDGLTFHRIMAGFMIQGGDPNGNGTGNPGYQIKGEFSDNGVDNPLSHKRGVISMARGAYNYDSAGCQFFIMHADRPVLDGQYASFGWVTSGMDVVDAIARDARPTDNIGTIPAAEQPVITTIKIYTK